WETVPGQRERLEEAGYRPGIVPDWSLWRRIAPMGRGPMQEAPAVWRSLAPPRAHGDIVSVASSGSTGAPLRIVGTVRDAAISKAFTLRFHLWHDIDMTQTRAAIREARDPACQPPKGRTQPRWGDRMEFPVPTGPSHEIDIHSGIEAQALWLKRRRPQYLLAFPSNIAELARHFDKEALGFQTLDRVMTISEVVTPELRRQVREAWGVECVDVYSARECGPMAFQCPDAPEGSDTPGYFVQAERVILEVLREDGTPAEAGETGHVVVTVLHNYAQPMIRYAVGDYAVAGKVGPDGRSPCGRGLPRLEAVRGRVRNMLIAADGRRFWPSFKTSGLFGK
ncbi:MAG: phenylacetate--CoA ligase family protein, partial [Pseudomonadota bacterium]